MGRISSFITGAAIGAIAALLLAPQSGEQTRTLVTEKAGALAGEAKDFGAGFPGSAQSAYEAVVAKGADLIKNAPAKVQEATGKAAPAKAAPADSDELREKIEAARKRIAAQVMENAEQTKAVDVAAGAAEVAEEAAAE